MSLKFLPLPLYIAFCLLTLGILIYFAISRRKIDRKGLLAVYITLSLCTPFMILGRTLPQYYDFTVQIVYIVILIVFIELTVMGLNDFRKGNLQKRVLIGLLLIWFSVIFTMLILFHLI